MTVQKEIIDQLASIPNVSVSEGVLLSRHTRFGIGGPADVLVQAASQQAFAEALRIAQASGAAYSVIGDGTNLIVSDRGFDGIVLRLTAKGIERDGSTVRAEAGAELQALVDYSIHHGLRGLETMTGIPGRWARPSMGTRARMAIPSTSACGRSVSGRRGGAVVRPAGVPISLSRERLQGAQGLDHS